VSYTAQCVKTISPTEIDKQDEIAKCRLCASKHQRCDTARSCKLIKEMKETLFLKIRTETPADIKAIKQITFDAFFGKPYSDNTEHLIIDALRTANALTLSFVAELENEIVGHIAFSKVTIDNEDKNWFGLGPISVRPDQQRRGIGSAMILRGLAELRSIGARGCVLVGNPKYYSRFGFKSNEFLVYEGAPPQYFMALAFNTDIPKGTVKFHKIFDVKEEQIAN
jgi:putative acetyltransferase